MAKLDAQATARAPAGRLQLIGLCRFSHLGEGAFRQWAHASLEERRAALFEPRRLDGRMVWFRHVLLPGIAAQTNKDFTLIVLTSDSLPEPWRSELLDLVAPVPQIRVVFRPPGKHRVVCSEVMHAAQEPLAEVVGQFRLDDDDAVSVDFVERVRSDHALLAILQRRHGMMALDYGKCFVLHDGPDGVDVFARVTQAWAAGMTLFFPKGNRSSLLDYPHHRVHSRMAFVSLLDQVMFIRGSHDLNDAGVGEGSVSFDIPPEGPDAILAERFGIDRAGFAKALASYRARYP